MANDVDRARTALEEGKSDEALILLWNAIEPARMAGDEPTLREIAALAQSIPGREGSDLLAATGIDPTDATTTGPAPKPTSKSRKVRPGVIWLVVVALVGLVNVLQHLGGDHAAARRVASPPQRETANIGLHLVPLMDFSPYELGEVAADVTPQAGTVYVRKAVPLDSGTFDPMRKQFVAEQILSRLRLSYATGGPQTLVVGVTSADMYEGRRMTEARSSVARSDDGLYVVISTFGLRRPDETRKAALERAVRKVISQSWAQPVV